MHYGIWYRAIKYGTRFASFDNGVLIMLAVFPRFLEFPGMTLEINPRVYIGPGQRAPRAILKMPSQR